MKNLLLVLIIVIVYCNNINAQNDTMYIMKSGVVVGMYNVNTHVDSIIFYKPQILAEDAFYDSRDGIIYRTVTIGSQEWMAENLRYLPFVVGVDRRSSTIPYYYVYGYDGSILADAKGTPNYTTYGVLYNWPAVMDGAESSSANPSGVQGVCPTGWHLPSVLEWIELIDFLGGASIAGDELKEAGTSHWNNPNTGSNESGFTALPGGAYGNAGFEGIGEGGVWWSATEYNTSNSFGISMIYYNSDATGSNYIKKDMGNSVRCVKD